MKIRGYRIEIAEIETALIDHPNIKEAVVWTQDDLPGDQRLMAELETLSDEEIQRFLADEGLEER